MDVEAEIERLYGLPLEEFVAERGQAARAARKEGNAEAAAAIAELKKPSVAAWAVNQLVRNDRPGVDRLLDGGGRLVDAQRAALEGGEAEPVEVARRELGDAVAALVRKAGESLGERTSDTTLERVGETLRSAAITAEGRELLTRGTLTKELTSTGWDALETLSFVPAKREPAKAKPAKVEDAEERKRVVAELRATLSEARERRAGAMQRVQDAKRAATRAQKALDAARGELEDAEAELVQADAAVDSADEAVAAARARR